MLSDELLTIERVAVLQRVDLFRHVAGHELVPIARAMEEVRVDTGTTFIEQGAVEDWLYVIADGTVRVHIAEQTVREMRTGDVVGDLAVLVPAPRSASVTATEPTLLLRLRRRPFDELLEDRPDIARAIISTLAQMLRSAPVVAVAASS